MSDDVKHGTYTAYARQGCHCDKCRAHQRDRVARNRAALLEALANPADPRHGRRSSYDAGCRCDACKGARREAYQRLDEELKAELRAVAA